MIGSHAEHYTLTFAGILVLVFYGFEVSTIFGRHFQHNGLVVSPEDDSVFHAMTIVQMCLNIFFLFLYHTYKCIKSSEDPQYKFPISVREKILFWCLAGPCIALIVCDIALASENDFYVFQLFVDACGYGFLISFWTDNRTKKMYTSRRFAGMLLLVHSMFFVAIFVINTLIQVRCDLSDKAASYLASIFENMLLFNFLPLILTRCFEDFTYPTAEELQNITSSDD